MRILPYRTLENVIEGAVITFVEIAELKQIEEALRESELSLTIAQRSAKVGNWTWDLVSGSVTWSDEMYRIFGVDKAAYAPTGESFAELVHPDDMHAYSQESFERSTETRHNEMEFRIIDQTTREIKHIHLWGETTRDAGGRPIYIVGTLQDITKRKQAEEELREYRDHLEELVDTRTAELQTEMAERTQAQEGVRRLATVVNDSNDAITVQNFEGRIQAWNRAAERIYGWCEEEALEMNIGAIVPEEHRAEVAAYLEKVAAGDSVPPFETQRVTRDGSVLEIWLVVTALVDAAGEVYVVATTERDVSARIVAAE